MKDDGISLHEKVSYLLSFNNVKKKGTKELAKNYK